MTTASRKQLLKVELCQLLTLALDAARLAHTAAASGATHEESRAENDKDTRGLEQSYLARGQAARVAELEAGLALVEALALRDFGEDDPIAMSALVTVEPDADDTNDAGETDDTGAPSNRPRTYFIAPHGGGLTLAASPGADTVVVITPPSPVGRALLGKRAGDTASLRVAGRTRTLEIVAVA